MKKVKTISPLEKQVNYAVSVPKLFANFAIKKKSNIIKLYPGTEKLVDLVFLKCVALFLLLKKFPKFRKSIISTPEFLLKNNMTIFLDKLTISSPEIPNTLHIHLYKILVLELTSKEKDFEKFWNPVCKEISGRLSSPIEIDYVDSPLNLSKSLLKEQEVSSQLLMTKTIKVQNKNCPKIYSQLSKYIAANPWEKEDMLKAIKIKLKPNTNQMKIINDWFTTSNHVYNKTIAKIKKGEYPNFIKFRDELVTKNTKKTHPEYDELSKEIKGLHQEFKQTKDSKITLEIKSKNKELRTLSKTLSNIQNNNVKDWECDTPKEIRGDTIRDVCAAYKSAKTNLINGNIVNFNMSYRKKRDCKCISIQSKLITLENSRLKIAPTFLNDDMYFEIGKKTLETLEITEITSTCRLAKQGSFYYLYIPVSVEKIKQLEKKYEDFTYCGVDPGERIFLTTFGNKGCTEYILHSKFKLLDKKKENIKKKVKKKKRRIRKRKLNKIEYQQKNFIDELHWKSIAALLNANDVVFFGDIKSHNIVKSKNHTLNKNINNLKFYLFKQRLEYRAKTLGKMVYFVPEQYTTQTCSFCGKINKPGKSEIYKCLDSPGVKGCHKIVGRDTNASKDMLIKGLTRLGIC